MSNNQSPAQGLPPIPPIPPIPPLPIPTVCLPLSSRPDEHGLSDYGILFYAIDELHFDLQLEQEQGYGDKEYWKAIEPIIDRLRAKLTEYAKPAIKGKPLPCMGLGYLTDGHGLSECKVVFDALATYKFELQNQENCSASADSDYFRCAFSWVDSMLHDLTEGLIRVIGEVSQTNTQPAQVNTVARAESEEYLDTLVNDGSEEFLDALNAGNAEFLDALGFNENQKGGPEQ
ncbi:hypothetical protein F5984_11605 [Rudanella paleaurantiibacter]|uniref:Uncharacterized protein n=1 Tax=Rudanella paleaurantiibacter TaxID=2614655 RepID=A0A7J5U0Z6_9BACT|nr:hypothetical protein [Rudanella paleaurantiibacter]KAB7731428.1 hypothetical protein F5984_11605 [Rudanella paleaurantiibacter]